MNEQRYVNAIAKQIKCSGSRKKEIKKQLLADIQMRKEQGESFDTILTQMGSIQEIADSFNETIPPKEQKQYRNSRRYRRMASVVIALALLACLVYWRLPKGADIADSSYFDQAQVEAAMQETVRLLDAKDYDALRANAIPQMKELLTEDALAPGMKALSEDWGERKQFGQTYIAELTQQGAHFAVGEITVTYENISVTYRLTYDTDMQLAGIYFR